jgi:hypothetical protein
MNRFVALGESSLSDVHKTGEIWERPRRVRAQIVRRVCEALEREYGRPRLGNPEDPLDDLVYIIVSNKTSPAVAHRTYARVKWEFETWADALVSPPSVLQSILGPAGLSTVKSQQIWARAILLLFPLLFYWSGGIVSEYDRVTWLDYFNYSLGAFTIMGFGQFQAVTPLAQTLTSLELHWVSVYWHC